MNPRANRVRASRRFKTSALPVACRAKDPFGSSDEKLSQHRQWRKSEGTEQAKQGKEQSTTELLQQDATTEESRHCDGQKLRQTEATIERRCYGQKPLQSFPSPSREGCYGLGQVFGSGYWHMQEALRWNRKRMKQEEDEVGSRRSRE